MVSGKRESIGRGRNAHQTLFHHLTLQDPSPRLPPSAFENSYRSTGNSWISRKPTPPSPATNTGPKRAISSSFCGKNLPAAQAEKKARYCSCTARRWRHSRRSICRCPAGRIRRRWISSPSAATTPGASTWKATAAPTSTATSTVTSRTAPTTSRQPPTTS